MGLSEEEKKALEELEEFIEDDEIQNISVFTAKKIKNIIEDQQKEIEELNKNKQQIVYEEIYTPDYIEEHFISKDKIRKYFMHEIAFKKRLQREKQKIDKYNRGRFDTIEEILELLEE